MIELPMHVRRELWTQGFSTLMVSTVTSLEVMRKIWKISSARELFRGDWRHWSDAAGLVGQAVAVVVDTVAADFCRNRPADHTGVEERLIDVPVAVVVGAVADFYARGITGADAPLSTDARLVAHRADAEIDSARADCCSLAGAALVDGSVTVVVDSVAVFRWNRTTRSTGIAQAIVDDAVAIVIDAIADFHGYRPAGSAGVLHALIDVSVTVVVLPIADFAAGGTSAADGPLSTNA